MPCASLAALLALFRLEGGGRPLPRDEVDPAGEELGDISWELGERSRASREVSRSELRAAERRVLKEVDFETAVWGVSKGSDEERLARADMEHQRRICEIQKAPRSNRDCNEVRQRPALLEGRAQVLTR